MSVGHGCDHGDEPAGSARVVRVMQSNPGLRAHMARPPIVIRSFRVPYLAGSSRDGRAVYVDAQTPERLPKSGLEPDEWYARHEMAEWWLMTRIGWDYERAHVLAHGIERMAMRLAGILDEQIDAYETESRQMVNLDEHAALPPEAYPPDLYLGPYESDVDSTDVKLLPKLRAAQMLRA